MTSRELLVAALVRHREHREPIDLVAPEIDADRMVRRRRVGIDDRPAHRDLASPLDLVLAPVARGDEPTEQLVAVDLVTLAQDDRVDVLDVRAESLYERAHGRDDDRRRAVTTLSQPPHDPQAPAHRLQRG